MTVAEVKKILSSLPDDMEVCVAIDIGGEDEVYRKVHSVGKRRVKKIRANLFQESGNGEIILVR